MNKDTPITIALAGNPNVGKSTIFNQLTGLRQHTGNWSGKTVGNTSSGYVYDDNYYKLIDIPGCYSLMAHSAEEEIARDFLCFGQPDIVIVVCDATCLERNLNLVLQIQEVGLRMIVCVNLLDEARKKGIIIDLNILSEILKVPVIGTSARSGEGLGVLREQVALLATQEIETRKHILYPQEIEDCIDQIMPSVQQMFLEYPLCRWLCARLLEGDKRFFDSACSHLGVEPQEENSLLLLSKVKKLYNGVVSQEKIIDIIVKAYVKKAEQIKELIVKENDQEYSRKDRRLDILFTSKGTGFLMMFILLLLIFWITIEGANYPSQLLGKGFGYIEKQLVMGLTAINMPIQIMHPLVYGVYRVLTNVIAVMLPPMAIFFPLFTLLEDFGYLPRVAYNLDKCFQSCNACGKQALTMCMGFGCNAVGVSGCRIIDTKRERLIAMLTNTFVPCNGRFPTLIAILTMFFVGTAGGVIESVQAALLLTFIIIGSVAISLLMSKILSLTLLKGSPAPFTLELPPYRTPQFGTVLIRSILDRTLRVLGRAAAVAAPAGLIIWLMANITIKHVSILNHCAQFLDPAASLLGLDGVILLAFILGFPANEIVLPIIIMAYTAQGSLQEMRDLQGLHQLLVSHGWTNITAISTMLFSLMHWPCSTTLLTIRKEAGSGRWMMIACLLPTIAGVIVCFLFTQLAYFFM